MVTRDRQWFQSVLDDLYRAIQGLSTTGYQWDSSDAWSRSSLPLTEDEPASHLEAWIDLGGISRKEGTDLVYASSITYAVRYQPDQDGLSQAILHASVSSLWGCLETWCRQDGVRTSPQSMNIGAAGETWLVVVLRFDTRIPRRSA
jgi:hypothetical protein